MKRCPECRRDYFDETLLYCLEDGVALVQGSVPPPDEPQTAIFSTPADERNHSLPSRTSEETSVLPITEVQRRRANDSKKRLFAGAVALLIVLLGVFLGYRFTRSAAPAAIDSIAVLPFANESGNPDAEYLSDGMTETLISSLARLPGLNVKSRSTVFRYKGKDPDPISVGNALNVQAVLTGRITQRGEQLTLSVELINVATENTIWSQRYDRKQSELLALQTEIARDVAGRLRAKLSSTDVAKVAKNYTSNPDAYNLYLKGRFYGRQFTLDGFRKAVDLLQRAVDLDPNYALAYSGLSDAYFYASTVHLPPSEALPKSDEYARKAVELDDSLGAAHHSVANMKQNYERDYAAADREYLRALELSPNDADAYFDYCWMLSVTGSFDRAFTICEQGHKIEPFDALLTANVAQPYVLARRPDEALEKTRAAIAIDNSVWFAYYWQGLAYLEKGMHDQAIASLQKADSLGDSPLAKGALAHALGRAGRKADALKIINDLIELSRSRFVSESSIAMAYAGLGDNDKAFEWLERSFASHDEVIVWLKEHPMFESLRSDPRYLVMLNRLNFPE